MKSNKKYKILLFLAGSLSLGICHAQTYSFQGDLKPVVTVQAVMELQVTGNLSNQVNFTTTSNFSDGIIIPEFAVVKIKSNKEWSFGVSTATPYFIASGSYSSKDMPSQVLSIRLNSQVQYQPLSTTTKILTTGNPGNAAKPGNTFNLSMKADPKYDYGPGIYTITINYTLTAP